MSAENQGNAPGQPLEKDFSNGMLPQPAPRHQYQVADSLRKGYHLDSSHDADDALRKIRTTGSLSISPELFEKIYLSPQNKVAGELRKTVGNPTPLYVRLSRFTKLPTNSEQRSRRLLDIFNTTIHGYHGLARRSSYWSCRSWYLRCLRRYSDALGCHWRGMSSLESDTLAIVLISVQWILGNTFPCVVFGSFGSFWIALTMTLMPYTGAVSSYPKGAEDPGYNNSFGFYLVCMGALCTVYSICALRTNLVLFLILFLLIPTFACLTAGYFFVAKAQVAAATNCLLAGGALAFVVCMLGWYIFTAILLASVDFPLNLPVRPSPCPSSLVSAEAQLTRFSLRSISHHQGRQRQEEGERRGHGIKDFCAFPPRARFDIGEFDECIYPNGKCLYALRNVVRRY